ncbi:phytoene desaturase family protein [Nocardia fusca]|uniref:phytoene desaturase family protein n=1 Tax=Nocardia fusca TaxID=941183 RepID=UPI0007A74D5C|nr:NAD(P)/FAD-dependent oxidoreductase [Nocardia fusca]
MTTAVVVGGGPNGLAAAVHLAAQGIEVQLLEAADRVGGGLRSSTDLTVPGLVHDHCAAIHPMGAGSPFLSRLGLDRYGLRWRWPEIDCAHPLDHGPAALLYRSLAATAAGLGGDETRWRGLFAGPVADFEQISSELLRPIVHLPRHPLPLAKFGMKAVLPAAALARWFRTPRARALFGGIAAHAFSRLDLPASSAVGLMIAATGHRHGWPVAEGGSQAIATALERVLLDNGGKVETGMRVRSVADLPPADIVLLDLPPRGVLDLFGERIPGRIARALGAYRHGPAAFKVDFAIDGPVPWRDPACRRAGTVHVGGSFTEIAAAERRVVAGQLPEKPFVLVGQQFVADPTRSVGDIHPLYAYAHVPHGYTGDATGAVIAQIERFAPGFREQIVHTVSTTPAHLAERNPNNIGGDIVGGANTARQLLFRPRLSPDPYALGVPGVFLCSAATPPGAGAHGMCGRHAAESALKYLRTSHRSSTRKNTYR